MARGGTSTWRRPIRPRRVVDPCGDGGVVHMPIKDQDRAAEAVHGLDKKRDGVAEFGRNVAFGWCRRAEVSGFCLMSPDSRWGCAQGLFQELPGPGPLVASLHDGVSLQAGDGGDPLRVGRAGRDARPCTGGSLGAWIPKISRSSSRGGQGPRGTFGPAGSPAEGAARSPAGSSGPSAARSGPRRLDHRTGLGPAIG